MIVLTGRIFASLLTLLLFWQSDLNGQAVSLKQEVADEKRLRIEIEEMLRSTQIELETVQKAGADERNRTRELEAQLERLRKAADGAEYEIEQEMAKLREQVASEAQHSESLKSELQVIKSELKQTLQSRGVCRGFLCRWWSCDNEEMFQP
jgi:chromosome segregation ATPase